MELIIINNDNSASQSCRIVIRPNDIFIFVVEDDAVDIF